MLSVIWNGIAEGASHLEGSEGWTPENFENYNVGNTISCDLGAVF